MKELPQFFDWRGELGRLDYLKEIIRRLLIILIIFGINIALCILAGLDVTSETWDDNLSLTTISSIVIMAPIDIRRLNDIGISAWWLVPVYILSQVPVPMEGSPQENIYGLLVGIPLLIWGLFVLFKPGKTLREARRSQG
jgi:uncharacterized membrane protein YhaH (DUF805 family)